MFGDEPAGFLREVPRLSRRAGALTASLSPLLPVKPFSLLADSRDSAIEDFLDWHTEHAGQPADVRDEAEGAVELLLAEWGPDVPPDERAFYAYSPHRIQACASILRDRLPNARSPPPAPRQQSWPARHTPSLKTRPPSADRSSEHCIDHSVSTASVRDRRRASWRSGVRPVCRTGGPACAALNPYSPSVTAHPIATTGRPVSRKRWSPGVSARPPAYPVRSPLAPMTRWHGTTMHSGLRPAGITECARMRSSTSGRRRAGRLRTAGTRRSQRSPRRRRTPGA